jgi:hypothetical protein
MQAILICATMLPRFHSLLLVSLAFALQGLWSEHPALHSDLPIDDAAWVLLLHMMRTPATDAVESSSKAPKRST